MPSNTRWREGTLFHNFKRYGKGPSQADGAGRDRLISVLSDGLRAPGHPGNGSHRAVSDLNITVSGTEVAYDSVVFLHRYRRGISDIYLLSTDPDFVCVVLDPAVPTKTAAEMGAGWPVMCQDEVYATEPIGPEGITDIYLPKRYLGEEAVAAALAESPAIPHVL